MKCVLRWYNLFVIRRLLIICSTGAATACLALWFISLWWMGLYLVRPAAGPATKMAKAVGFQCGRVYAAVWPGALIFPLPGEGWSIARTGLCQEWLPKYGRSSIQQFQAIWIPLWMPLAFFACYPAIAFIRGPLRRWRRRRAGLCTRCAYNLTGNQSGLCPECGIKVHPQ